MWGRLATGGRLAIGLAGDFVCAVVGQANLSVRSRIVFCGLPAGPRNQHSCFMTGPKMHSRATRWVVLATLAASIALALSPQGLIARWTGDRLQVTSIGLHFLTGKALDRLHGGAAVPFAFRLSLFDTPQPPPLQSSVARFIISYDVWAEKFKVVQQLAGTRKAVSSLAPSAAEAWCVSQLGLTAVNVPADRDLCMRLEIRAQ